MQKSDKVSKVKIFSSSCPQTFASSPSSRLDPSLCFLPADLTLPCPLLCPGHRPLSSFSPFCLSSLPTPSTQLWRSWKPQQLSRQGAGPPPRLWDREAASCQAGAQSSGTTPRHTERQK